MKLCLLTGLRNIAIWMDLTSCIYREVADHNILSAQVTLSLVDVSDSEKVVVHRIPSIPRSRAKYPDPYL